MARTRGNNKANGKRPVDDAPPRSSHTDEAEPSEPRRSSRRSRKEDTDHLADSLCTCRVVGTRFIDWNLVARLGLTEELNEIFEQLGIRDYMHTSVPTYISETIMFLQTMRVGQGSLGLECLGIQFEIRGVTHTRTVHDIRRIYGFREIEMDDIAAPSGPGMRDTWRHLAERDYAPGEKSSMIRNPAIRFAQRALGFSFFGRHLVGTVTREEWRMICSGLQPRLAGLSPRPQPVFPSDPATLLLGYLQSFQEKLRNKTPTTGWKLCIGGVITPILVDLAVRLGPPLPKIPVIDEKSLWSCHFLDAGTHIYQYRVGDDDRLLHLPRTELTHFGDWCNIQFRHPSNAGELPGDFDVFIDPADDPPSPDEPEHSSGSRERHRARDERTDDATFRSRHWRLPSPLPGHPPLTERTEQRIDMMHRAFRWQARHFGKLLRKATAKIRKLEDQLSCRSRHTDASTSGTAAPGRRSTTLARERRMKTNEDRAEREEPEDEDVEMDDDEDDTEDE